MSAEIENINCDLPAMEARAIAAETKIEEARRILSRSLDAPILSAIALADDICKAADVLGGFDE